VVQATRRRSLASRVLLVEPCSWHVEDDRGRHPSWHKFYRLAQASRPGTQGPFTQVGTAVCPRTALVPLEDSPRFSSGRALRCAPFGVPQDRQD
jgi:hypothetical protein